MIHPIFLWSDVIFFILLTAISVFFMRLLKQAHWRLACGHIVQRPIGMITGLILLTYFSIALLDSLHFEKADHLQTYSVLDSILSPLGEETEKTYSAPFATHLLNQEMQIQNDGSTVYGYPALQYAKLSAKDAKIHRTAHIISAVKKGVQHAAIIWIILATITFISLKRVKTASFSAGILLITLAVILCIICVAISLASQFHILGTDRVGHDIFYLALKSIRTNLFIGMLALGILLPFAIFFGMAAGYFSGWVDDLIQYIYTVLNSVPDVLLIVAAVMALQIFIASHAEFFHTLALRADLRLLALCTILGMTSWTGLCRILRAETLKLREMEYVRAAQVLGMLPIKILFRHILPNVMPVIMITMVLDFSGLILTEAVLTYVGVGVDPSMPSWGNLINAARLEMARDPVVWWPLFTAFLFMFILVISANLFADVVRTAFDPKKLQVK